MGDPFAEREIDPVGVVDEEAQRLAARLLDGDQVDLRSSSESWLWMSVCRSLIGAVLRAVKKVGQAHFSTARYR